MANLLEMPRTVGIIPYGPHRNRRIAELTDTALYEISARMTADHRPLRYPSEVTAEIHAEYSRRVIARRQIARAA